jgi:hypothetical protein
MQQMRQRGATFETLPPGICANFALIVDGCLRGAQATGRVLTERQMLAECWHLALVIYADAIGSPPLSAPPRPYVTPSTAWCSSSTIAAGMKAARAGTRHCPAASTYR